MKYENVYELNENGVAKTCPKCHNEEISKDDNYCEICGASLVNRCTNEECGAIGSGKARYCKICGSETEFFKRGYLESWDVYDEYEIEVEENAQDNDEENMVEIEIAHDDGFDDHEDEAPEIDHYSLGDFGVVYQDEDQNSAQEEQMEQAEQDDNQENQNEDTYDKFHEFSYKGGDEFFEIF